MENYKYLFSSTNPLEIDQIKFSLEQDGIPFRVLGEQALGAGNVELTGITGASIQVEDSKFVHAQKVLNKLGYDTEMDANVSNESNKSMILLTVATLIIGSLLSYFIFSY